MGLKDWTKKAFNEIKESGKAKYEKSKMDRLKIKEVYEKEALKQKMRTAKMKAKQRYGPQNYKKKKKSFGEFSASQKDRLKPVNVQPKYRPMFERY